jgi:DNA-binding NarL/FixJ family response regulator
MGLSGSAHGGIVMSSYQPVFATRHALRIGAIRQLLTDADIAADVQTVFPEELERVVASAGDCLVIVDGQWLPGQDTLQRLRRLSPGSRIVIWTATLSTDLLLATMECGLDGLLSSGLPPDEAAYALSRICRGERVLRFDSDRKTFPEPDPARQVAEGSSFDAQWMLHGAEPQGREK